MAALPVPPAPSLDLPESSLVDFLFGFFFSLAKIDCLATNESLCCLGELEPAALVLDGLDDGLEEVPDAAAVEEAAFLAVVVINNPAAVFLVVAAAGAEDGLLEDDMVVLARVILGLEAGAD